MLKTEGIVLKEIRYKDTSKILSVYTKKYGKISVMARGAYKPKSQMIASTQPFCYNEYSFHNGRNFYYINQADILDSFYSIREKIERVAYGHYLLELVDKSIPEEQENEKIFDLLIKGLSVLSALDDNYLKFIIAYELKFISFLGYKPHLDRCVTCKSTEINSAKFSILEGGLICEECFPMDYHASRINTEIYKCMYGLMYSPLDKIDQVEVDEDILYQVHKLMISYILHNIEVKKFNSLSMINELIEH